MVTTVVLIVQSRLGRREVKALAKGTQSAGVKAVLRPRWPDPGVCSLTSYSQWPPKPRRPHSIRDKCKSELWIEDTPEMLTVSGQLYMQERGRPTDLASEVDLSLKCGIYLLAKLVPRPRATK